MKFNRLSIIIFSVVLAIGCADEDLKPILTFADAGKGAVIQLIEESDKLINVLNESTINASSYTYSVEFSDLEDGNLVTEYKLDLVYNPVGGAATTINSYKSWGQSDFVESDNGLRSLQNIQITAPDILQALGLQPSDLSPGDQVTFKGYIVMEDGLVFGYDNSSAPVRGSAFKAHFDFTLPAACPSDLTGTFSYDGSNFWCGAPAASGTVDIEALGGGVYIFSDWSFGAYPSCYGGIDNSSSLTFTDVCGKISFSGAVDKYGDTWTWTSSIVGNDWTIDWVNTYGESGSAVIHYTGGADWPITLAN